MSLKSWHKAMHYENVDCIETQHGCDDPGA
jgi:hypothetical protein